MIATPNGMNFVPLLAGQKAGLFPLTLSTYMIIKVKSEVYDRKETQDDTLASHEGKSGYIGRLETDQKACLFAPAVMHTVMHNNIIRTCTLMYIRIDSILE